MITSINQLNAELKAIQEAHYQLNDYYFGEFNLALQKRDLLYPVMICDYNTATLNANTSSVQMFITIADKVYKDNSNLIETKSDTLQICRDLFNIIKKSQRWGAIGRVTQGSVNAFIERGKDEVSGHVMNITIDLLDSNGICSLPMNGYDFGGGISIGCDPALILNSNGIQKNLVTLITLDN